MATWNRSRISPQIGKLQSILLAHQLLVFGMVFDVTGMKAAVDSYRVAMGAEQEKDTQFDPITELTFSKCIEMFAESIPGIVIQRVNSL